MQDMAAIILAAGEGTRMKADRAKVLHEIAGVPMIRYVVETALAVVEEVVVVIGHQAEDVRKSLSAYPSLHFALQQEQLGTGHAVLTGLPELSQTTDIVILCGDVPLLRQETVRALIDRHTKTRSCLTLLVTELEDPSGYGRIVLDSKGDVERIVEQSDASDSEKAIAVVNTGTYCINIDFLNRTLPDLNRDNAQGEFYLTDVVERAYQEGEAASLVHIDDSLQVLGVNTMEDLSRAEKCL